MGFASGAVGRWTRAFVSVSAAALFAVVASGATDIDRGALAVLGLFGFVLPMVYGMGYVLLPAYVARTLRDPWLAGVQFVLTSAGLLALVAWAVLDAGPTVGRVGSYATVAGVGVFLVALGRTAAPVVREDPLRVLTGGDRPQRTTRLATAVLPVGLAFLAAAHLTLLAAATAPAGPRAVLRPVVHLAGGGFAALLVFALGARLLLGFFHVETPRPLLVAVLVPGALGPALLATRPVGGPWFVLGGALEALAMTAYLGVVGLVAARTERRRVGLAGVLVGAGFGVLAVAVALLAVTGVVSTTWLDLHARLVLQGFFGLTVVGYAFLFFPVTDGHVPGATRRTAAVVVALLAAGLASVVLGEVAGRVALTNSGALVALLGVLGYGYLLLGRFARDAAT